jgi:Holliday junction resolvase YEN1
VASIPEFLAKQLLKQFGFPIHLAPGEAEAECALLQREGIVDAVLSEDVDTLMFGSGLTIRNWSPEQKSSKTPTHVNVYDAVRTKNGPAGLDREGMILIALMSGGDYVPEGIPGCGPKTACEAARAGFGSDLCKIASNDKKAMREWRERLQHELKTNESRLFVRKRPSMKIPDDFPRTDILGYYTHPAISSQSGLEKLKRSINWDQDLDFPGLRDFTHDAFDWVKLEGAKHFIRSLAPSLLVRHLRLRAGRADRFPSDDVQAIEEDETLLVKGIHGKRQHAVTDNTTELRVSFTPIELVRIDLTNEEPDDDLGDVSSGTQAPEADLEDELPLELDDDAEAGPKKRGPTKFEPENPVRVWILETYVKVGVPLKVQDWEAGRSKPLKPKRATTTNNGNKPAPRALGARRAKTTGDTPQVTIDRFAKVTKPGVKLSQALSKTQDTSSNPPVASEAAPKPNRAVVDLLSSSPARPTSTVASPIELPKEKSLTPVPELPSSITKRRRRGPMQRSQTLPSGPINTVGCIDTSSLDTIETLDLVDLPPLPSPSQIPAKKAKTRITKVAPTLRVRSVVESPVKTRQTTLDVRRGSPTATPTKSRSKTPPAPPKVWTDDEEVEIFDLTLSSPPCAPTIPRQQPSNPRTIASVFAPRPALAPISPNASQQPSHSSTSQPNCAPTSKPKPSPVQRTTRRASPRLRKTKSASPEIEALDLTKLSYPPSPSPPPPPPIYASTAITTSPTSPSTTTKTTTLRRSPRAHTSLSPNRQISPPAAWKLQAKKKREIRLRQSLAGAWDYVDVESPVKPGGFLREGEDGAEKVVLKGKDRRRWRESEIEVLDLT